MGSPTSAAPSLADLLGAVPSVRFGHVGLTVSDLERSVAFYTSVFGFEPGMRVRRSAPWIGAIIGEPADLEFAHLHLPSGLHLELIQYRRPAPLSPLATGSELTWRPAHQHFCLTVSGIDAWIARAREHGARVVSGEPVTIPEGKNAGARCCYLRGPDGETIELFEPVSG
jgi:catechol 2,3-dioxygenase-like lactoylglutathione lyase family enzyme